MCKILLVEDELIEREALKLIISQNFGNDVTVVESSNSEDAIKAIDTQDIDLVFMDIKIPGISGIELSKYIKDKYPLCAIIITTAHNEFEFAHAAIKIHVDDFLLKPIRREKIVEAIQTYGDKRSKSSFDRYDSFINSICNDIRTNSYTDAKDKIKELVGCIYAISNQNIDTVSKLVLKTGEQMAYTASMISITSMAISRAVKELKDDQKIYNNSYYVIKALVNVLDKVFEEIIKNYNGFDGDMNCIINYVETNIKNNISLEDVSNYCNMSSYYMSKIFKKEVGINFIDYVTNRKMDIAKELLENTKASIVNIAIELGYNEPNYFSKVFKKKIGVAPTTYRKNNKAV